MKRLATTVVLSLAVLFGSLVIPLSANAQNAPIESGLLITPVRQFLSVDAGKTIHSSFSVANLTDKPVDVDLQVRNFSVTNYSYDYTFSKTDNSWVRLSVPSIHLEARKTQSVPYDIHVPAGTAPGGHYYTLVASATVQSGAIKNTIQAADLLYLTVNGKLSSISHLESSHIQRINFGREIPFTLQPVNTGNVYTFVYVSSQLHGLSAQPPKTSSGHLLMPGHVRTLNGAIPSPVLPGIYKASYGYKTEHDWIVQESSWIIYIPPWSIATLIALLLVTPKLIQTIRRKRAKKLNAKSED